MRTTFSVAVVFAVCVQSLNGCSASAAPSVNDFQAAIDAYLKDRGRLCFNSLSGEWPIMAPRLNHKTSDPPSMYDAMSALEHAGLLKINHVEKGNGNTTNDIVYYDYTPKGQQYVAHAPNGAIAPAMCFGQITSKVNKWSEAPPGLGKGAQLVFFQSVATGFDWTNDPAIAKAAPIISKTLGGENGQPHQIVVTQTNAGWSVVDGTLQ